VLLQCSCCKAREMVQQSVLESDVYLVNEGIVRSCKRCGSSTIWKRATEDAGGETVPLGNHARRKRRKERSPLRLSRQRHRLRRPRRNPRRAPKTNANMCALK